MRRVAFVLALAVALGMFWSAAPSHGAGGRGEQIFGRVVDGCGRPVVRAPLHISRTRPVVPVLLIGIHTDARGRYYYPLVKPARYWITVRARGFRAQTKTVRVRAGQSVRVNFRFRRCAAGPALAG